MDLLKKPKDFEKEEMKTGFLYVMNFGEVYKIGQTGNIKQRLTDLRNANPFCQVLKQIEMVGYIVAEALLHQKFEDKRIQGEWFALNQRDLDSILPFLREKKHGFRLISVMEFEKRPYTHTDQERIRALLGVNKSLEGQNKVLKRVISDMDKNLHYDYGRRA